MGKIALSLLWISIKNGTKIFQVQGKVERTKISRGKNIILLSAEQLKKRDRRVII
jgi:hypothetical protein